MVVAVLFKAGDHVPLMPFVEVVGNGFKTSPLQIGATWLNVGVTLALTVTVIVVELAHSPAVGVKVYVVFPGDAVLTILGLQVPVTPFPEVVGRVPGVPPTQ